MALWSTQVCLYESKKNINNDVKEAIVADHQSEKGHIQIMWKSLLLYSILSLLNNDAMPSTTENLYIYMAKEQKQTQGVAMEEKTSVQ